MEDILEFKKYGIELKAEINYDKEHAIINNIIDLRLDAGTSADRLYFVFVLEDIVRMCDKFKGNLGKLYVTLPVYLTGLAKIAGFEQEVSFPKVFNPISGEEKNPVDAIDMVYFLNDGRRMSSDEERQIMKNLKEMFQNTEIKETSLKLEEQGYQIHKAVIEDAEQIAKVWNNVFWYNDDYPDGLNAEDVKSSLKKKGNRWMVCENPGKEIVGIASLCFDKGDKILDYVTRNCEIADCAVLPEERDKGIMTDIVKRLTKTAKESNQIPSAYCCTNETGMHKVMASLGYIPTGISQKTNKIVIAKESLPKPDIKNTRDSIPFVNNVVWFYTS